MKKYGLLGMLMVMFSGGVHADLLTGLVLSTLSNMAAGDDTPSMRGSSASSPQSRAQIHTELGIAYFSSGQLAVAIQELNQAVETDSHYAPAYNMLGLVYMQIGENDKAQRNFEKALSLTPSDSEVHNNYGWFLYQTGHPQEALGHFLTALKNPLYATPEKPYLNAGLCSVKLNDDAAAEDYFLKALQRQPAMVPALYGLADIAYRHGDYAKSKMYIDRYMQFISQPPADVLWMAVRASRKAGDRTAEADYGFQLRKRFPDSKEVQSMREGRYE